MTADEFKTLQAQRGWTIRQTAEALGRSVSTVVKWRGGQHQIPQPVAIAMRALCARSRRVAK